MAIISPTHDQIVSGTYSFAQALQIYGRPGDVTMPDGSRAHALILPAGAYFQPTGTNATWGNTYDGDPNAQGRVYNDDWLEMARERLGAQANAVIGYLNQVAPDYDWTRAINAQANIGDSVDGYYDPARTGPASIAWQIVMRVRDGRDNGDDPYPYAGVADDPARPELQAAVDALDRIRQGQAATIQAEQATHGGDDLTGFLLIAAAVGASFVVGPEIFADAFSADAFAFSPELDVSAFGEYAGDGLTETAIASAPLTETQVAVDLVNTQSVVITNPVTTDPFALTGTNPLGESVIPDVNLTATPNSGAILSNAPDGSVFSFNQQIGGPGSFIQPSLTSFAPMEFHTPNLPSAKEAIQTASTIAKGAAAAGALLSSGTGTKSAVSAFHASGAGSPVASDAPIVDSGGLLLAALAVAIVARRKST